MDQPLIPTRKNPRTHRLVKLARRYPATFRLSRADRGFLRDLARVQLLSRDLIDHHHYAHLKHGAESPLARLERAGILRSQILRVTHRPEQRLYSFANQDLARVWGGKLPVLGARRTSWHEMMVSRLYYELGCPEDFRVAANFSKEDLFACGSVRPDALYTDPESGELVAVEADSGHYSAKQINQKINRWRNLGLTHQVWGHRLWCK